MDHDVRARLEQLILDATDVQTRIDTRNELAWWLRHSDMERSLELLEETYRLAQESGYDAGLARTLRTRGWCRLVQARFAAAEADCMEALERSRELGDAMLEADCLHDMSLVRRKAMDYSAAVALLQHSRTLRAQQGDRSGEAISLNNLGALCIDLGRHGEALACLQEGLAIANSCQDTETELFCRSNIANIKRDTGDLEAAITDYRGCLESARLLGNLYIRPHLLSDLCEAHLLQGDIEAALHVNEDALALARETSDRQVEIDLLLQLGRLCDELGLPEAARTALQSACEITERLGDRERQMEALYQRGALSQRQGDTDNARFCFLAAEGLAREAGSQRYQFLLHRCLASLYKSLGEHAEALYHDQRFQELEKSVQSGLEAPLETPSCVRRRGVIPNARS